MQIIIDSELVRGADKEQQIDELAECVEKVESEIFRITSTTSTLKIEDLTINVPSFDSISNSTIDQGASAPNSV